MLTSCFENNSDWDDTSQQLYNLPFIEFSTKKQLFITKINIFLQIEFLHPSSRPLNVVFPTLITDWVLLISITALLQTKRQNLVMKKSGFYCNDITQKIKRTVREQASFRRLVYECCV